MKSSRYRFLAVIALLVGLAVAVPAQAAQPLKRGLSDFAFAYDQRFPAAQAQPSNAPPLKRGLSDFGLPFDYSVSGAQTAASDEPTTTSGVPVGSAFSWRDAGVGAGAALLFVAVLGLVVLGMRLTRERVALP
jgi:hypothetical protein